jgi:hypothetical protein
VTGRYKYRELVLQAGGWTLLCNKNIVAKSKEVKTDCILAESSEEGFHSERAVFAMLLMNKGGDFFLC